MSAGSAAADGAAAAEDSPKARHRTRRAGVPCGHHGMWHRQWLDVSVRRMVVYGNLHRILGEFPIVSVYFHLKWKMWKDDLHRRIFLGMGSSQQPVGG